MRRWNSKKRMIIIRRLCLTLLVSLLSAFSVLAIAPSSFGASIGPICAMGAADGLQDQMDAACFDETHAQCQCHSLVVPISPKFRTLGFLLAKTPMEQSSFTAAALANDPPPPRT